MQLPEATKSLQVQQYPEQSEVSIFHKICYNSKLYIFNIIN